jgi:hypothetical protein
LFNVLAMFAESFASEMQPSVSQATMSVGVHQAPSAVRTRVPIRQQMRCMTPRCIDAAC